MQTLMLTLFILSVLTNAFLVGQLFKVQEERDQFINKLRQYPQAKRKVSFLTREQSN
jgi:hypothetical protein